MNFKNIVLIDFESVQPEALPGLDLPHKFDTSCT